MINVSTSAPTNSIPVNLDLNEVLAWFTGKMRDKAQVLLGDVLTSAAQGFWKPHASRPSRATFYKGAKANKLGRELDAWIAKAKNMEDRYYDKPVHEYIWALMMACRYGNEYVVRANVKRLEKVYEFPQDRELLALLTRAESFVRSMLPLIELMNKLDNTRPPPVFTWMGVSPTVTDLLLDLGMNPKTIAFPDFEHVKQEITDAHGNLRTIYVTKILWPEGTKHGCSPFDVSRAGNSQCQACGHAIKNPGNWVPLFGETLDGTPASLWVGSDCAKNLFGIKVTGEVTFAKST